MVTRAWGRFLFLVIVSINMQACGGATSKDAPSKTKILAAKDASAFYENVASKVIEEYVDQVDQNTLLEGALNGMLTSLDPHSAYLSPEKLKDMRDSVNGEYAGLGMEVTVDKGLLMVVSPMDGSPAEKGGIKPGDFILAVDGKPTSIETLTESVKRMQGSSGTKVKLMLRRGTADPFELELTRAIIKVEPVKWRTEGNTGYIRITTFINKNTKDQVIMAIKKIKEKLGEKLKGYVLDLRNNAGGLLDQAVDVTDIFIKSGVVVSIRGRNDKLDQVFRTNDNEDLIDGLPLVVLINSGSASASEIVAGALQDHLRAVVVGTRSFGKGSVQVVMPMVNGGAIKLTTSRYFTPNGRSIQKEGIVPDVEIEQTADLSELEDEGLLREADLTHAITNGNKKKNEKHADADMIASKLSKEEVIKKIKDYQLERAIDVLRGMSLYGTHLRNKFEVKMTDAKNKL